MLTPSPPSLLIHSPTHPLAIFRYRSFICAALNHHILEEWLAEAFGQKDVHLWLYTPGSFMRKCTNFFAFLVLRRDAFTKFGTSFAAVDIEIRCVTDMCVCSDATVFLLRRWHRHVPDEGF